MLYVFLVDTGSMLTLEMSLTTESVQTLKEYIERTYRIPADHQVLLISGGECLDSTKRVCSYSSGTDTNPIYLFCKLPTNDASFLQSEVLDFREPQELLEKEKLYAELPPSFQTVTKRAQLAQQFADSAKELLRKCEQLVSDQHNQHQGWAAVVANFEDVLKEFRTQFSQLKQDFNEYLQQREYFLQFLNRFKENLHILRKVPILTSLLPSSYGKKYLMETSETSEGETQDISEEPDEGHVSLFEWIGRDEHDNDLEKMYENCVTQLMENDIEKFERLCAEVGISLHSADRPEMKEIRGLGPRLFSLDKLIQEAKKKVQEQIDLATSVNKNQSRVQNLKDSSILPDLCASHIKQLNVMAENHKSLMSSMEIFTKAKLELNNNLHTRLQWVMHTQNNLQKIGIRIDVFGEIIARLRYQLGVLEQVDLAPVAYLSCIAEIVRRRSYSQAFLVWASELACRLLTIHNEEVAKRKDFQSRFEGHFIQILFPGMGDLPPSYGTRAPSYFDTGLPKLSQEDLEFLINELPELAKQLNFAETGDPPYLALFKSLLRVESEKLEGPPPSDMTLKDTEDQCENVAESKTKEGGNQTTVHGLSHLKDLDRGCESETDTEEFEKVGQSPLDLNYEKDMCSPKPGTQDAATLTEDNLKISKSEHDKLKLLFSKIGSAALQSLAQLKVGLTDVKREYSSDKGAILQHLQKINESYETLCSEQLNREKLLVNQMVSDHSNEINDFRKLAQVKNEEIKNLRSNVTFLENRVKKVSEELVTLKEEAGKNEDIRIELENRILVVELEKERCVKEVSERLTREHKNEMKTLQARFKLMTMERTPSDSNLDKTLEFSSLTNHESIINQLRENFELEKEMAVKETLANETNKWEKVIEKLKEEFEVEKNSLLTDLASKMNEESNKQMEALRNREQMLIGQIKDYTSTIEQLTNVDTDVRNIELLDKIDALENEKVALSIELHKMKADRIDMAASVASCQEGKTDIATSPIKQRKSLTKSLSMSSGKVNKVCIDSLKHGDCVVVVWDEQHESFKVIQDSPVLYFLHCDSISSLNLEISEGPPKRPNHLYCLGEYVGREYCYARKSENRYKVPRGTRFFRVKVRPLERGRTPQPSPEIDIPMTQSHLTSHRTSSGSNTEPEFHSLPPSPKIKSVTKLARSESPAETASDNVLSDPETKGCSADEASPFTTATYDFPRPSDDPEEPVSSTSDINDSVRISKLRIFHSFYGF